MGGPDGIAGEGAVCETVPVRVLISYAHDDETHRERVRAFWLFLRANGIDARVDLTAAERRQDWAEWMTLQVRDADRILVVGSPAYRRRAEGDAGSAEGRGVQWEARLIRDRFYSDQRAGLVDVLPVVLPGCSEADIPAWLAPTSATFYRVGDFTVAGAEALLRVLTAQPRETEPELGPVPRLLLERGPEVRARDMGERSLSKPGIALPPGLQMPEWVVGRPAELTAVVDQLVNGEAGMVGITTGLYGAGGFGKTTLAQMVAADERIKDRFDGRVYMLTVGRDVRAPVAIAAKVDDLIRLIAGVDTVFIEPGLAGQKLGFLLDVAPSRLLILDDVWWPEQLAPFAWRGRQCARLVTTRAPELLARRGPAVLVDRMSLEEARVLLTSELPQLDEAGARPVGGDWPVAVAAAPGQQDPRGLCGHGTRRIGTGSCAAEAVARRWSGNRR